MNRRRQIWRRWSTRLLKAVVGSVALVLLGFLLIQLLLATPWMRGKVESKLSSRIGGLGVRIDGLSWTPWSGASFRGLLVEQPDLLKDMMSEPLLEVDEIHLWPDYAAAVRGEWTANEVTVLGPRIHATVEMLASLAVSAMPDARPPLVADDLVLNTGDIVSLADDDILTSSMLPPIPGLFFEPVSADEREAIVPMVDSVPAEIHLDVSTLSMIPDEPDGEVAGSEPDLLDQSHEEPSASGSGLVEVKGPVQAEPKAEEAVKKRLRLRIKDGSLDLTWIGRSIRVAALEGIDLDLPVFVDEEHTSNSIGLIELVGQSIEEDVAVELTSRDHRLTFGFPDEDEGSGLSGRLEIGLVRGLAIQSDLALRLPAFGPVEAGGLVGLELGEISFNVQGGGWLLAPGSLSGVAQMKASQVEGSVSGEKISFDSAEGELRLSGGLIESPDFRLMGEEVSLLGNAWATARDGAAVVRVVVPFSLVGNLNQELSELIPGSSFAFKPLEPDNRWISDVSFWREEAGLMVGFGAGGSEMPIEGFVSRK